MTPPPLSEHILERAAGHRCGIVQASRVVVPSRSDPVGVFHAVNPGDPVSPFSTQGGGAARTALGAKQAAIGEALERYAAFVKRVPLRDRSQLEGKRILSYGVLSPFATSQYESGAIPHPRPEPEGALYTDVHSLVDGGRWWVPHEFVVMGVRGETFGIPTTSTGLSAHPDPLVALLRGVQEVLERDALAATWLNGLGGRERSVPETYAAEVLRLGGDIMAFDLTQVWNPHPVIAVTGEVGYRGRRRIAFGMACRSDAGRTLEKAYIEWVQGLLFAKRGLEADRPSDDGPLRTFEDHGLHYTRHPEDWAQVPLVEKRTPFSPPDRDGPEDVSTRGALQRLCGALSEAGIRFFYRDLTPPDVRNVGMTVVRVLSPECSLIHADERTPFLGRRTTDVAWRYPGRKPGAQVPNSFPHPLA